MITSPALTSGLERWQTEIERLLELAPLTNDPDVAVDAAADPEAQADRVIETGNAVFDELENGEGDSEASAQVFYFALANFAGAEGAIEKEDEAAVDAGGEAPAATVAMFADLVRDPNSGGATVDAVPLPKPIGEEFESIENATGAEVVALVANSAVQLSGQLLDDGLTKVLTGTAANAFHDVKEALHKIRDAFKRAATKILGWITDRLAKLLPAALRDKLAGVVDKIGEKLSDMVAPAVGSAMGFVLGRPDAEKKWEAVIGAGKDVTAALEAVTKAADAGIDRIGMVSKGRKALDKFGVDVVLKIATKHPAATVAYICAVVAVFGYVSWQLWDGIRDIEALAPA